MLETPSFSCPDHSLPADTNTSITSTRIIPVHPIKGCRRVRKQAYRARCGGNYIHPPVVTLRILLSHTLVHNKDVTQCPRNADRIALSRVYRKDLLSLKRSV